MLLGEKIWYFLVFQNAFFSIDSAPNIKIAGIFEDIELHQTAFKYSNDQYNFGKNQNEVVVSHIVDPSILKDEPFTALKGMCSFLRQSIVGIFGPQSSSNLDIIQSITERKDIPHIVTRWFNPSQIGLQTINFFPNPEILADGFLDIINALEWRSFTILYTDAENLLKINEFIKKAKDDGIIVYIEHIDPMGTGDLRPVLRNAGRSGQKNFVIDCPIRDLQTVLTQLQQVGLLTAEFNYFLTNLDAHTEDLSSFQHSDAVLTGVHLIKAQDEIAIRASQDLCHLYNITFKMDCGKPELDVETALILDSVSVFLEVLNSLGVTDGQYLDCSNDEEFSTGLSIINTLKSGSFEGVTGQIEFDKDGFRKSFQLTIYQIRDNFYTRGTWNTSDGLSEDIQLTFLDEQDDNDNDLKDREITVLIALTEPYARLKDSSFHLKGNDRFEGFAIDLIEEIAFLEGFDYSFTVREDSRYGNFDPKSGKWNGMIGDIIEGKADMAIADLSINKERLDPVEFTHPFMSVGIGILFRKPEAVPPSFFHFAQPFSISFWQYLGISYLIMVFSLFLIGRFSPSEWQRKNTYKKSKTCLVNDLTLLNAFWFTAAGLFRQPTNVRINSIGSKIIAAAWYIYCFVLFALYISYSFSRVTFEDKEKLFDNAEELLEYSENNGIKLGAKTGGATEAFFKNSKVPAYQEIAQYMQDHPEEMAESTNEGIRRAENGDYAFFMESATIEYTTRRHCSLTSYGGLLDSKGFGIAIKKGSSLLGPLNKAIIKLQSSGELKRLKKLWWDEKYAGDVCVDEGPTIAESKTVAHITGLIYISFLGTIIAIVLSFLEFTLYVLKLSKKIKESFGKTFKQEIKKCFKRNNYTTQNVDEISLTSPDSPNNGLTKENA